MKTIIIVIIITAATTILITIPCFKYHFPLSLLFAFSNVRSPIPPGLLSPGVSVPLAVPGQNHDMSAQYWTRLQ